MTKPEKFFSKKHLIRAGWAIIIAIVGFAGGLFFSWLRGPDTINVTSTSNKQPVIVRIENSDNNNSKYDAYLDAIREEIRLLRNTRSYSNARGTLNRESTDYNRVKIPPFKFPKQFDRYTNNSLNGIARGHCPPKHVNKGEYIVIGFELLDNSIIPKATPLFVTLSKLIEKNKYLQDMKIQYELREGNNKIRLAVNSDPGVYMLEYGIYFLSDLSHSDINFFRHTCEIVVR